MKRRRSTYAGEGEGIGEEEGGGWGLLALTAVDSMELKEDVTFARANTWGGLVNSSNENVSAG